MLKTHCLGGKHNWHINYIIQALVIDFLPELKNLHDWQLVNLEGPDLEVTYCQEILAVKGQGP